jgi:hypothetical protein
VTGESGVEEHLADLARAMAAEEKAIKQLIVDELAEALPALERAEEDAAAVVRETCTALGMPEKQLADLDAEIERVTGKAAGWQERLSALRTEDRVEARVRFAAWSDELDKLKEKRDQAERDLQPYYDARNKATADLGLVQGAKRGLCYAMLTPYESPVGQGTRAYVGFRSPRLAYVLLAGDQAHPEWECAIAQLEEMCLRSAYRTDHLPSNAEQAARAITAEMADASSYVPPAPNAQEILAADAVKLANDFMPPSHIDDYRNSPAPPRRDYMQLPGRGAR